MLVGYAVVEMAKDAGVMFEPAGGFRPVDGELETFNAFAFFKDPDGNGWAIQQGPAQG